MELQKMTEMLKAARSRAAAALALATTYQESVDYAKKRGLKTLESLHGESLKRAKTALARAESLVDELEKEVGQLELAGKKPAK